MLSGSFAAVCESTVTKGRRLLAKFLLKHSLPNTFLSWVSYFAFAATCLCSPPVARRWCWQLLVSGILKMGLRRKTKKLREITSISYCFSTPSLFCFAPQFGFLMAAQTFRTCYSATAGKESALKSSPLKSTSASMSGWIKFWRKWLGIR